MTPPAKILFAHDDHAFGRTLGWILDEHGYAVTAVPATDTVLETMAAEPHDLLVLETSSGEAGRVFRISRWRWEEEARPVRPTLPSGCPAATTSPFFTRTDLEAR